VTLPAAERGPTALSITDRSDHSKADDAVDPNPGPMPASRKLVDEARAGRLSPERRDQIRAAELAAIPRWYSPWGHLAATTGVAVITLLVSAWRLHIANSFAPTDLLVVPLVFMLANFFEWRVHKHVLHRRRRFVEIAYEKHTPMHHMIYVEDDMAIRSTRELRLVLLPALGILGIVVAAAPFATAVGLFWSETAGFIFLATCSVYLVSYELLHLAYHLPFDSFIGRRRMIAALRQHHGKHHDPRLMQRWNFNVNVPLFDWIMGTIAPSARGGRDQAIDQRATARPPGS
jgi:hypothetical protein